MSDVSKPRLLVLASTYPRWKDDHEPGFVHELSRRLASCFQVTALCPHAHQASRTEEMDGVDVQRYRYAPSRFETLVHDGGIIANLGRKPWKWLLLPSFTLRLAWVTGRLVREWRPSVIHAHWLLPQGLVVAILGLFIRMPPMVVTAHGADLYALRSTPMRWLKRFVIRRAAAITVVSSAMRKQALDLGAEANRIHVMPMGANLKDRFTVDETVSRNPDSLLFVGRLVAKKGLTHLLDAMPRILAERPNVILHIVGFGPEERPMRDKARALGIEQSISFLGARPQSELPYYYRSVGLCVAPFVREKNGDQEGLPVVLMEAIGCGCPVIAGEIPGIHDLLGVAASSICVTPQDTSALAAAILRMLSSSQEAAGIAMRIRDVAIKRMDWEAVASAYRDLLMECRA